MKLTKLDVAYDEHDQWKQRADGQYVVHQPFAGTVRVTLEIGGVSDPQSACDAAKLCARMFGAMLLEMSEESTAARPSGPGA